MGTEGEFGEMADCPDPSIDSVYRFFNSTWNDFGLELAIAHDSVGATWSVLTGSSSIYARYGDVVSSGFVNDNNSVSARLDADDFVITGPAGPVTFTVNVAVNGAVHASSNDAAHLPPVAGVNIGGNIITPTETCPMTIGGGNVNASGGSGYGVYAAHIGGPAVFTSNACHVDTGAPFRILIDLGIGVSIETAAYNEPGPGAEASASSGFSVSFPSSGPVFNLPVGYTAFSAIAQVEDNGYLPEPDGAALAGSAVLTLATCGLRRARVYSRPPPPSGSAAA